MHLRDRLSNIYLFFLVLSLIMHICTGCNVGYPSQKGLERHENQCILKIEQQTVPDNAFEIYKKKQERKRQKAIELKRQKNTSNLPLLELPYVRRLPFFDLPLIT